MFVLVIWYSVGNPSVAFRVLAVDSALCIERIVRIQLGHLESSGTGTCVSE